jgi:uncharacterized protein Yka (UPF0111/DUF47 family)
MVLCDSKLPVSIITVPSATEKIKEMLDGIGKLIENRVKNVLELDERREKLEIDIKQLRQDMENHLDTIENNLLGQLNEAYSHHRDLIKTQEIEFSERKLVDSFLLLLLLRLFVSRPMILTREYMHVLAFCSS